MSYTIKYLMANSKLDKIDTRLLICHTLGFSTAKIITHDDYQLSSEQYGAYTKYYEERCLGVPLNYILGYKEFYSRKFKVTPDTLIPRPETELLVDIVLQLAKDGDSILDLGTGSGCIAISCKLENPSLKLTGVDNYPKTLDVARDNAHNLSAEINFIQSDWLVNITDLFDIIVSNPPYIEANDEHLSDLSFEPQAALTDFANGLTCIWQIICNSGKNIKNNGYLVLEHGYNQAEQTRKLMLEHGFTDVVTIRDYAKIERITLGRLG